MSAVQPTTHSAAANRRVKGQRVHRRDEIVGAVVKYFTLGIAALVAIVPIVVVLFAASKTSVEYGTTNALTPPGNPFYIANYIRAFTEGRMALGFLNTVLVMAVSLTGAILLGSMVAYVISRFRFRGRRIVLLAFLFATLVPAVTTQVATFRIVNFLGLYNTRWAAIVLFMGTDVISIYIFTQFMDKISISLDESAMLDGASYLRIFAQIVLPLTKPAITTVLIIKGVAIYNEFYIPFLYMPRRDLHMVSTALYSFQGPFGSEWEVICAAIMIATIPTLLLFLFLQKDIYNGFTSGSVTE